MEEKKLYTPYELFSCEGLDKNSGWAGLVRCFLHKIETFNKDKEDNEKLLITQIKEKWGGLCLYTGGLPTDIYKYRNMLEKASHHICEHCGSPFHVGKYQGGWIETVCEECAKKDNKYGYNYDYCFTNGEKNDNKTYHIYTNKKNKKIAWKKLEEKLFSQGISYGEFKKIKLVYIEKYFLWKEQYHSVKMDWIISFALKIQKFNEKIIELHSNTSYKIYRFKMYVKTFFKNLKKIIYP